MTQFPFGRLSAGFRWMLTGMVLALAAPSALTAQVERETVREVQDALVREGFDPGPVDGLIGPKTREAVRKYQAAHSLKVNGRLTTQTLQSLRVEGRGEKDGMVAATGRGVATGGKAVGKAGATAGKATAKGATTAGKATGKAGATAGKAVAKGSVKTAKVVAAGSQEGAGAAAKGTTKAAKATAKGVSKAAGATKRFLGGGGSDNDLRRRVEISLDEDSQIDADKIGVEVDKGIVTLVSKGASNDEMKRAVTVARKVEGVKDISLRVPNN